MLIMERIGARRWMFIILAVWGVISAANAFMQGPSSYYALRFLLGVAEAGVFPRTLLFMTDWFPHFWRGRFPRTFLTPHSRVQITCLGPAHRCFACAWAPI